MMNFKMIEKPLVMLFLLCLLPLGASAQSIVKGIVKDSSGEPIIGATIKVNGSKVGAVTDLDGNFSIDAAPGSTLTITYVRYGDSNCAGTRGQGSFCYSER